MEKVDFFLTKTSSKILINNTIKNISTCVTDELQKSFSIISPTDNKKGLSNFIKTYINRKKWLRSLWQRSKDPVFKSTLNRQTTFVRDLHQAHRDKKWSNFLGIIEGMYILFKLNRRHFKKFPPDNLLINDNGTLFTTTKKPNFFPTSWPINLKLSLRLAT